MPRLPVAPKAAGSRGGTTTDQKSMNTKYTSLFSEKVLGQPLLPSDSHDEEGALMTKNQEWFFVPHVEDPVRGRPTIRHPEGVLTERPRWGLEMMQSYPGGYWDPPESPEFDLVEIDRFDSLEKAIEGAAIYTLRQQIAEHGMYCQHLENLENPPPYEDWNELA